MKTWCWRWSVCIYYIPYEYVANVFGPSTDILQKMLLIDIVSHRKAVENIRANLILCLHWIFAAVNCSLFTVHGPQQPQIAILFYMMIYLSTLCYAAVLLCSIVCLYENNFRSNSQSHTQLICDSIVLSSIYHIHTISSVY